MVEETAAQKAAAEAAAKEAAEKAAAEKKAKLADPERELSNAEKRALARVMVRYARTAAAHYDELREAEAEALEDLTQEQFARQLEAHLKYLLPREQGHLAP